MVENTYSIDLRTASTTKQHNYCLQNCQVIKERVSEGNFLGDVNSLQFDQFGKYLFFQNPV